MKPYPEFTARFPDHKLPIGGGGFPLVGDFVLVFAVDKENEDAVSKLLAKEKIDDFEIVEHSRQYSLVKMPIRYVRSGRHAEVAQKLLDSAIPLVWQTELMTKLVEGDDLNDKHLFQKRMHSFLLRHTNLFGGINLNPDSIPAIALDARFWTLPTHKEFYQNEILPMLEKAKKERMSLQSTDSEAVESEL